MVSKLHLLELELLVSILRATNLFWDILLLILLFLILHRLLLIPRCFPTPRGGFDFGSATLPWADIYFAGSSSNPASNNFELTGISTSGTRVITFPDSSGIVTLTSDTLGAFSATTSSQLAGVISDETGNGALVFANNPSLITPA